MTGLILNRSGRLLERGFLVDGLHAADEFAADAFVAQNFPEMQTPTLTVTDAVRIAWGVQQMNAERRQ